MHACMVRVCCGCPLEIVLNSPDAAAAAAATSTKQRKIYRQESPTKTFPLFLLTLTSQKETVSEINLVFRSKQNDRDLAAFFHSFFPSFCHASFAQTAATSKQASLSH